MSRGHDVIGSAIPIPHEEVSERLFGACLEDVRQGAFRHIRFYMNLEGAPSVLHRDRRCMSLYSASDLANHRRIDEARAAKGQSPVGFDQAVASRSFFTLKAETRDVLVSRGAIVRQLLRVYPQRAGLLHAGPDAGEDARRVGLLDVGWEEVYNLADAFLCTAVHSPAVLRPLVDVLVESPETLLRVYDLNDAMLLCFEYLFREAVRAGALLPHLNAEVNSPEVFALMNRKTFLHPSLAEAKEVDMAEATAFEQTLLGDQLDDPELRALGLDPGRRHHGLIDLRGIDLAALDASFPEVFESLSQSRGTVLGQLASLSQMGRMGILRLVETFKRARRIDVATENPGLNVLYSDDLSMAEFVDRCREAAELLRAWFGFERLCLKWERSTDGENIVSGITSADGDVVDQFALRAYGNRQSIVVEAHTDIDRVTLGGESREVSPSVLIVAGRALKGRLSPQKLDGKEWVGNEILNAASSAEFGIDTDVFQVIEATTEFIAAAARNHEYAISIGGIDYAVCTVGGIFGDRRFVIPQDPNLRYTGSVPAHAIYESMAEHFGTAEVTVSTRKYVPGPDTALEDVVACLQTFDDERTQVRNICYTPTWSMFAVAGTGGLSEVNATVGAVRQALRERGLAE